MYNNRYIWDKDKYETNFRKHGITFQEAATVFDDPNAIIEYDEEHSYDEERFSIMGLSKNVRLLIVCHCYRNGDAFVRIISARAANKKEKAFYTRRADIND